MSVMDRRQAPDTRTVRRREDGDLESWKKWESDRVVVREIGGRPMLVGSYCGNIFAATTKPLPVTNKPLLNAIAAFLDAEVHA